MTTGLIIVKGWHYGYFCTMSWQLFVLVEMSFLSMSPWKLN